jgi:hypothetical protein
MFILITMIKYLEEMNEQKPPVIFEEFYELFGDCCLAIYNIDKERYLHDKEAGVSVDMKHALNVLLKSLKIHDSFDQEGNENLNKAKALESLLLSCADTFSFFKKQVSYETCLDYLMEHNVLDTLFYEVLFYVPGKTQSKTRNKAVNSDTRRAGFLFLYKLVKVYQPKDLLYFLRQYIIPSLSTAQRPKSWCHKPEERLRKADEPAGIRNLGNVCYMISALQQCFMVPKFRFSLLQAIDKTQEDLKEHNEQMIDDNMLKQLQKLFGSLQLTERTQADITEFCFAFKDMFG